MKKFCSTSVFFILAIMPGLAQQDPLSSHYMFNTMSYNPGVSGMSRMICATVINRQQWVGFDGAPSTTVFNINTPLPLFNGNSGAGLLIQSDDIGFDRDIKLSAAYSHHLNVGTGKLGIGFSLGMMNKTLDPKWMIPTGDIHTPAPGDPLIPENKESYVAFDAGLGMYYLASNYYASLSVTHINQPTIKFTKGLPYVSRHYYLTAGYTLQMRNPSLELIPSVFAFSDAKVLQFTVTSLIRYNKKIWGGVSYRAGDALIGMFGIELYNGIRLGYAYDFTISDISKNSSGSHEFMVNYCFDLNLGKSPMKYKSIRFL